MNISFHRHQKFTRNITIIKPDIFICHHLFQQCQNIINENCIQPKKPRFMDIREIDPQIDLKSTPKNDLQHWAIGTVFKTVNQGANKCLSNIVVIENYEIGPEMVQDYHKIVKSSSEQLAKIPALLKVKLNKQNIIDVQRSLLETYLPRTMIYPIPTAS